MSLELPSLDDLIHAICEGTAVDWDALENVGSDSFRSKVAALRVVAGIARVHRTEPTSTPNTAQISALAPKRWGHLDVLEHIASGAFGDVYRAWDPQLDREVALKLLRRAADAESHADEVVDEGRLLARLRHPHIVSIYGAACIDGRVGLWMEYLRGATLAQTVVRDGALSTDKVVHIGAALCDALAAVHGAGQVHRDVKAQNVMLADDGRVVLMDFGAGRDVRHAGLDMAGTPLYLAPEVVRGAPASPQSDIYSLGVLLRYALTGSHRPNPATARVDAIHRRVAGLIARATALEPADRFASASSFGHALRTAAVPAKISATMMTAGGGLVLALLLVSVPVIRLGDLGDAERQWARAWRASVPSRVPLTAETEQSAWNFTSVSASEMLVGVAQASDTQQALVTINARTGAQRRWMSYDQARGHVDRIAASLDGSRLAYAWVENACRCASLRIVNERGEIRDLIAGDDVRAIWLGGWSKQSLPAVIGRTHGRPELVVVDVVSGAVRRVKQSMRTPKGFGLSPDGRFLAFDAPRDPRFDSPRDIVMLEVATRREWRLVEGSGDRLRPVWSLSGDRVFYLDVNDRRTALAAVRVRDGRPAGTPSRLQDDLGAMGSVGVSAGGIWYWKAGGPADVFVVELNPAGGPAHHARISDGAGFWPTWSPDGRWLAWSDGSTLRLEDRTGHAHRTVRSLLDSVVLPAWSRDSRRIAFWSVDAVTHSLEVVDLASGAVTEPLRMAFPLFGGEYGLAWLPGDTELLVSLDNQTLEAVDVGTGKRRTIYASAGDSSLVYFFVSPDGHSIALGEVRGGKGQHTILSLNGTELQSGISANGLLMGWDPDGRHLVEVRFESRQSGPFMQNELWRVPLDGSAAQPMGVAAPGLVYASLAPDGRRVAYGAATFGQELWNITPGQGPPE